jgi:hypothetical protein
MLALEVDRGIPDLIGEGELWKAEAEAFCVVWGVKSTCLAVFEAATGVVGIDGSAFSKFGLLGLLLKDGIDTCAAAGFLWLGLTCLRIDLTRSNLPGLLRLLFKGDFGSVVTLFVVADLVNFTGVPLIRFGFEGDLERVGICVDGPLTLAFRASEACVGVEIASRNAEERACFGVDGTGTPLLETGLADEVSSAIALRARFVGAVFSKRSLTSAFCGFCDSVELLSSLLSKFAFDCVRLRLAVGGANRAG